MTKKEITKKYNLSYVGPAHDNMLRVKNKDDLWGHVNRNGEITTPIIFDGVGVFFKGKAEVTINDHDGEINKEGEIVDGYYELIRGIFI